MNTNEKILARLLAGGIEMGWVSDAEASDLRAALANQASAAPVGIWPAGYSVNRVEGHGWYIDTPKGGRWVAFEGTQIDDLLSALAQRVVSTPADSTCPTCSAPVSVSATKGGKSITISPDTAAIYAAQGYEVGYDAHRAGSEAVPVAYLRFRAAQQWGGSGNHDIENAEWLETCHAHEIGDDKLPAFPVYTTPPAAPLGLTDTDKRDAERYRILRDFGDDGKPAIMVQGRWYGAKQGNGVGFDLDILLDDIAAASAKEAK